MEIEGSYQFKAPLSAVWDALLDPNVLSKALPGGDQLERVDENDYKGAMNVKVGPVQGRFEGKVTLTDVVEHQGYHMKVSGTGSPGFLNGEGDLVLTEVADGTVMTYKGDVQVGGRIAAVGQRLIDSTAKAIIKQGLKALDDEITNGSQPVPVAESETRSAEIATPAVSLSLDAPPQVFETKAPTAAASAAAVSPDYAQMAVDIAKDVAQDLTSDYIPRERQPQVFAFIMGALAMLLFVILVRLVQRD